MPANLVIEFAQRVIEIAIFVLRDDIEVKDNGLGQIDYHLCKGNHILPIEDIFSGLLFSRVGQIIQNSSIISQKLPEACATEVEQSTSVFSRGIPEDIAEP